jgi:regulator of sigma E protease
MEYVLSFVVVVGIIIFVHELGHFLAARAVGIRVDRFSLGFGPKMVGVTRGETEYRISWIPSADT